MAKRAIGAITLALAGGCGALAFVGSPAHPREILGASCLSTRGAEGRLVADLAALRQQGDTSSSAGVPVVPVLVGCCLVVALVARGLARRGHTMMQATRKSEYSESYGGGYGTKIDPFAEFGPQYWGPRLPYGISHRDKHGVPGTRQIPGFKGSWEHNKQVMRSLTTELIKHGRIKTSRQRAKFLGSFVDRMIVLAKRGDDLSRREAGEWMMDQKLVDNLFKQAPERYSDKQSGFTLVTQTMRRQPDSAEQAYIELI
mmetsp:Transcript_90591/g.290398  ORF Transcript_90591/g.290398 Transcript_90591/m.290398 type:complete len:257 (+) Transcript_90591:103-873(+)